MNASNTARSTPVGRADLISEAGEIFTPAHTVDEILDDPEITSIIKNPSCVIMEPAAGDGNFIVGIVSRRLNPNQSFSSNLDGLYNIWCIEIQEDNLLVLKQRVRRLVLSTLSVKDSEVADLDAWIDSNFLCGDFLTGRACNLSCKNNCIEHKNLLLPYTFDLIVANPPYNPNKLFIKFVDKSLNSAAVSVMILPTSWKISGTYKKFRTRIAPHARKWTELPWSTFSIKPRTGILTLSKNPGTSITINGRPTKLYGPDFRFESSILEKAYAAWPNTLKTSQGSIELYIGWKCNLQRDGNKVNMLQSLDYDRESPLLPNNLFHLTFATEEMRRSWVLWSSTKLAAYLQQQTDSDTVCRELPFPTNLGEEFKEQDLYDDLGLTADEVASIASCDLYVSGKAAEFYNREGVKIDSTASIGNVRKSCSGCGSSSFHKKGCPNSTEKEILVRDS